MITRNDAARLASRLHVDGFRGVDAELVLEFARTGSLPQSSIGDEYDAALESRLLQELDEYELEL